MATIERVKVRAKVTLGTVSVETPFVQSFNVNKQRGQISTFNASLKVKSGVIIGTLVGNKVEIAAGENSTKTIFTGICRQAKMSPCFDDPSYVILTISGADVLSLLAGKKFTRRSRATQSTWISITGVTRKGLKSGRFASKIAVLAIGSSSLEDSGQVVGNINNAPSKAGSGNMTAVPQQANMKAEALNQGNGGSA